MSGRGLNPSKIGGGVASPRLDSYSAESPRWGNSRSGLGGQMDRTGSTKIYPGAVLSRGEVNTLLKHDGLARRICTREPQDAIRRGVELEGMDDATWKAVRADLTRLHALERIADGRTWAKAFGGGAVVIFAQDGEDMSQPINTATLRRVASLIDVDRWDLTPASVDLDPNSSNFGRPRTYYLNIEATFVEIHHSRVIRFDGIKLPRIDMRQNDFWGGSQLDLVWIALRDFASSHTFGTEAVSLMSQGIFTTDLEKQMQKGGAEAVARRLAAIRMGMGMLGDIVIDRDETYDIKARSMSGLAETLRVLGERLISMTDMPKSVLFGLTPGGLNTGENAGEIQSWYDHVDAQREPIYTPALMHLLAVLFRCKEGPTGGVVPVGWEVKWGNLWQEDEKEKHDNRLKAAQARQVDVASGVISEDEARKDPALVEIYGLDPETPAPGLPTANPPMPGMEAEQDGDEEDDVIVPSSPLLIPADEKPVSARELAGKYGIPVSTVRTMARKGMIRAFRFGTVLRYLESEMVEAVDETGRPRADAAGPPVG